MRIVEALISCTILTGIFGIAAIIFRIIALVRKHRQQEYREEFHKTWE